MCLAWIKHDVLWPARAGLSLLFQIMSSQPDKPVAMIRDATEDDIPAIVSLVLTSFRQFPLFAYLYSPLTENKDTARDTVYFWGRRVLLDLLDPASTVHVAEVPNDVAQSTTSPQDSDDPVEQESWRMLDWVLQNSGLSQASRTTSGYVIVGFTIWKDRVGEGTSAVERAAVPKPSWISKLRTWLVDLETSFWSKYYQRRDRDAIRYAEYEEAEERLERDFYHDRCFYLDNLCVDFRYQRLGIGGLLLQRGMKIARQKRIDIKTEASEKGVGLYRKAGFEQIGEWEVGSFVLPVMRLQQS